MLRYARDWQSLLYMLLLPLLVVGQWRVGFSWPVYTLQLFLTMGIGVIHHNHAHLSIWYPTRAGRWLNRISDFWLSLLQGHPVFVFYPAHIANHHRYHHGAKDIARTYRFHSLGVHGDVNHLWGYLVHPLQAIAVLYPVFITWLIRLYRYRRAYFYYCILQYLAVIAFWLVLLFTNAEKCLILVLIPQLFGLHWLLGANYLQHAHADGRGGNFNFARNFYGWVNPLLFNIGLHTAHHKHPRAHWSRLTELQQGYDVLVDPGLREASLIGYIFRTYFLGLLHSRWRSRSFHKKE